jgi:hypothetical protein
MNNMPLQLIESNKKSSKNKNKYYKIYQCKYQEFLLKIK